MKLEVSGNSVVQQSREDPGVANGAVVGRKLNKKH